jgi:hypothetical protein
MNINAGIIDQHVRGLAARLKDRIEETLDRSKLDDNLARSVAFVILCVKTMLDLTEDEALDRVTEGGNDLGIDAIDIGDIIDGQFTVTLFQGKYNHVNLDGVRGFPQVGIEKAALAIRTLFNPSIPVNPNRRLQTEIETARGLILDGNIPRVRVLLCNNGKSWEAEAQSLIERERFDEKVTLEHVNHDTLVRILQSTTPVKDTLQFSGKSVVEDHDYARIFLGKMPVAELARLMDAHGDRLLDRNVRRFLGSNDVNNGIHQTLVDETERNNFYFYNNGITMICDRFDYNGLQSEDHKVRVEGLQIINGGQTSKTVQATLNHLAAENTIKSLFGTSKDSNLNFDSVFVLVRLYQVPHESSSFIQRITYATNSQNPVDLRDLRANDGRQLQLETSMRELGYDYRRQRSSAPLTPKDISTGTAAEAVLSVWRRRPQQARFRSGEHFGKLYSDIFTPGLNAAQVVLAVLLFRIAENKRKRPSSGLPDLVRYGSCFAAMLMGQYLLADLGVDLSELDHRNFTAAQTLIEQRGEAYFTRASAALDDALRKLYGGQPVSLLRLSATFRRGDLLQYLPPGT